MSARAAGRALGLDGPVVDLVTVPGPSGHIAQVTVTGPDTERTLSGSQVEADLGLRSTWFEFAWLSLTPPPAAVSAGTAVSLAGTARGLTGVTLESRTTGGSWQLVGPVSPDGTGAFTVRVKPAGTTEYRLSTGTIRGALVKVTVN